MRIPIILLFVGVAFIHTHAQSLTSSKGNTNAILLNGSAITLNITDPSLRIDFQRNLPFKVGNTISRNNGYTFGISAEGKNQTGIANIFSEGDLVPAAKITGMAGFVFSNNIVPYNQAQIERIKALMLKERAAQDQLIEQKAAIQSAGERTERIDKAISASVEALKRLAEEKSRAAESYTDKSYYRLSVFGFGGTAAKSFKRFIDYDPANLLASFKNENARGGFFGLGVNYQYRNFIFGSTLTQNADDNQSLLSLQTYNWQRVVVVNNQTITETKEIKAYKGSYGKVNYLSLNVDIVANISLDEIKSAQQARNYMMINPYVHTVMNTSNTDLLPNTTNIGTGIYIFDTKSKLLGGIYVELPDVSDKIEKSKVAADRNIRPSLQKLSFGIVTRFNLQSFLQFENL